MKLGFVIVLALGLAACAQRPDLSEPSYGPPATSAQKDAAADLVAQCYVRQAAKADDRISDANVIGAAVAKSCEKELWAYAKVMAQGQSDTHLMRLFDGMKSDARRTATSVVLSQRAKS